MLQDAGLQKSAVLMDMATQTTLSFESRAVVDFNVLVPRSPADTTPPSRTSPPTPLRSRSPVEPPLCGISINVTDALQPQPTSWCLSA